MPEVILDSRIGFPKRHCAADPGSGKSLKLFLRLYSAGVLLVASIVIAPPVAQAGEPTSAPKFAQAVTGTISEQRAQLRKAYSVSVQELNGAREAVKALPRGQESTFTTALSGSTASLRAADAAVSAATTQAQVDAASKLIHTESVRSSTAKQAASKLVRLQQMRVTTLP